MFQLVVSQASPNVLYASTFEGYFRSTDDGVNWSAFSVPNVTIASLAIDPNNAAVVYVGTSDGRVLKSSDGGTSWSDANVGLPGAIATENTCLPVKSSAFQLPPRSVLLYTLTS